MKRIGSLCLVPVRRGVTVLEIIVVISCIGILTAIVLGGIAKARNTARANDCRNRLRQLGVATHSFESVHNGLPAGATHFYDLLPYVGQKNLYEQLQDLDTKERFAELRKTHGILPQFACPSDSFANPVEHHVSFRLNQGTTWGFDEKFFPYNGMVSGYLGQNSIPLQQVSDGQSNTLLYSERLAKIPLAHLSQARADAMAAQNQKRFWWELPGHYNFGEEAKLVKDCQQEPNRITFGQPNDYRGISLFAGKPTWYDHLVPPNSTACKSTNNRITPATSQHTGGVNALLVDGSVKFVSESIGSAVWSALGTRAGNEVEPVNW